MYTTPKSMQQSGPGVVPLPKFKSAPTEEFVFGTPDIEPPTQ